MYSAEDVAAQLNVEMGVLMKDYPEMFDEFYAEAQDNGTIVTVTATRGTRTYQGRMYPSTAVTLDLNILFLKIRNEFHRYEVN